MNRIIDGDKLKTTLSQLNQNLLRIGDIFKYEKEKDSVSVLDYSKAVYAKYRIATNQSVGGRLFAMNIRNGIVKLNHNPLLIAVDKPCYVVVQNVSSDSAFVVNPSLYEYDMNLYDVLVSKHCCAKAVHSDSTESYDIDFIFGADIMENAVSSSSTPLDTVSFASDVLPEVLSQHTMTYKLDPVKDEASMIYRVFCLNSYDLTSTNSSTQSDSCGARRANVFIVSADGGDANVRMFRPYHTLRSFLYKDTDLNNITTDLSEPYYSIFGDSPYVKHLICSFKSLGYVSSGTSQIDVKSMSLYNFFRRHLAGIAVSDDSLDTVCQIPSD